MVVHQSAFLRNQRIAARALYATSGMAIGAEIVGILHEDYFRIFTVEFYIVFVTGFILAYTFVWLTAKRNIRISITKSELEISDDEDITRFGWHEVKRLKQPALLRHCWLFELKKGRKIKIPTYYFSKTQIKQLKTSINRATNHLRK